MCASAPTMGCESSQPMVVASAAKNEVDEQLERLHEEERTHYKARVRSKMLL